MSDVTPLRAPAATLRKDFDAARDTLHCARSALGVALRSLLAKDEAGADVAEEYQALQLVYVTISEAEALFDDFKEALPD